MFDPSSSPMMSSGPIPDSRAAPPARIVVIVGGGFCGTALAIRLLRESSDTPLRIVIVEPRAELGAGAAYATRDYPYPLNVAAGQMSLDSANPGDFLEFACGLGIHAEAVDYLPRQVYGEYLRARLASARAAAPRAECVHIQSRALRLQRGGADQRGWELWLDDGRALQADEVVLALGNPAPAPLPGRGAVRANGALVEDPWSLDHPGSGPLNSVLLVGSGLTMIDAALRVAALRPRVRHIHVLSRHGLLPQPQAVGALPVRRPDLRPVLESSRSARGVFRAVRAAVRQTTESGGDWREVVTSLRGQLPTLWRSLDAATRSRLLRHARSIWDVHRHRVPVGPLNAVRMLERVGVLDVNAGRILELNPADGAVEVVWQPRGATRNRAWLVDRVVNCTGPDGRVEANGDPFVQSLLGNGWIRADALRIGVDVAPDCRPIGRNGEPVENLHCLGPWLRARDWEASAVGELREHAAALAKGLAERTRNATAK